MFQNADFGTSKKARVDCAMNNRQQKVFSRAQKLLTDIGHRFNEIDTYQPASKTKLFQSGNKNNYFMVNESNHFI